MKTCTEQGYFDALIRKYAPFAYSCPTRAQVEEWRGRLPDFLLRWWSEQGWGSLSKGQYWVCNPEGRELAALIGVHDHRRMHAVFGRQFRHSALALHGLKRHARLEPRVIVPAFPHA